MSKTDYALIALMDERGMSQADLCRQTGINAASMSGYVHGDNDMSAGNAIKIAEALEVTTDRLLNTGFDDKPRKDTTLDKLMSLYARLPQSQREKLLQVAQVIFE